MDKSSINRVLKKLSASQIAADHEVLHCRKWLTGQRSGFE